jgi:hypothetical protein
MEKALRKEHPSALSGMNSSVLTHSKGKAACAGTAA